MAFIVDDCPASIGRIYPADVDQPFLSTIASRKRACFATTGGNVIQDVVFSSSIVLMGALAALFAWVAAGADLTLANYGPAIASAYRLRGWLFAAAVAVLVGANYRSFGELPYVGLSPQSAGPVVTAAAVGE